MIRRIRQQAQAWPRVATVISAGGADQGMAEGAGEEAAQQVHECTAELAGMVDELGLPRAESKAAIWPQPMRPCRWP